MAMVFHLDDNITQIPYFESDQKKYFGIFSSQKKNFILCCDCYWMASTLSQSLEETMVDYKNCPVCKNETARFPIPESFNY